MAIVFGADGKPRPYEAPKARAPLYIPNVQPGFAMGGMINQPPRVTELAGQPHMLAYVNPEEVEMLMDAGSSGYEGPMGIPAFPPDSVVENDNVAISSGYDTSYGSGSGGEFGGTGVTAPPSSPTPPAYTPPAYTSPPSSGGGSDPSYGSSPGGEFGGTGVTAPPSSPTPPAYTSPPSSGGSGSTTTVTTTPGGNTTVTTQQPPAAQPVVDSGSYLSDPNRPNQGSSFTGQGVQVASADPQLSFPDNTRSSTVGDPTSTLNADPQLGFPGITPASGTTPALSYGEKAPEVDVPTANPTNKAKQNTQTGAVTVQNTKTGEKVVYKSRDEAIKAGAIQKGARPEGYTGTWGQDYNNDGVITFGEKLRDMTDGGGAGYTDTRPASERQFYTASGKEFNLPGTLGMAQRGISSIGDSVGMAFAAGFGGTREERFAKLVKAGYTEDQANAFLNREEENRARLAAGSSNSGSSSEDKVVDKEPPKCPKGYIFDAKKNACVLDTSVDKEEDTTTVVSPPPAAPLSDYLQMPNLGGGFVLTPGSEEVDFARGGRVGLAALNPYNRFY